MKQQDRTARSFIITLIIAATTIISSGCAQQRSGSDAVQIASASKKSCRADAACPDGFCDRGTCATPKGVYGRACQPAPRTPEGPRDGMLNVCGAYLCLDGRCRSCTSDKECRAELGSPQCYKLEGEPGLRCGNPAVTK